MIDLSDKINNSDLPTGEIDAIDEFDPFAADIKNYVEDADIVLDYEDEHQMSEAGQRHSNIFEVITENMTLVKNKKYLANGSLELTLPAAADAGDSIEIFSNGFNNIMQNDAENVIQYMNKYYTTKGTTGKVVLKNKTNLRLVYAGVDSYKVDTGTKVSALTAPEGTARGCAFSPDGIYLAVVHFTSPYITVYKRSGDTFTKVSALTAPEGTGYGCAFSPDGIYLAVAHSTSPYITVYKRSGDTFTKVSALTVPEGAGHGCAFSPDGIYLAVVHTTSPYITVYKNTLPADKVWFVKNLETLYETNKDFMFK